MTFYSPGVLLINAHVGKVVWYVSGLCGRKAYTAPIVYLHSGFRPFCRTSFTLYVSNWMEEMKLDRWRLPDIMLRRVSALYNNSKVLLYYSSSSPYQFDSQSVLYFLYGVLLVQFLGSELTAIFVYFYLHYIDGGMMFDLPPVGCGPNAFSVLGQPVPGVPFYVCSPTGPVHYLWVYALPLNHRSW